MAHGSKRAARAYERAHLCAAIRCVPIAMSIGFAADALYCTSRASLVAASVLAATLVVCTWHGGGWKRGSRAGFVGGAPIFVAPALGIEVPVTLALGLFIGHVLARRASVDSSPRAFKPAAVATLGLSSLLGILAA